MARSSYILDPIEPKKRVLSLDILRGFAVLGIVVMNIQSFAMPSVAYSNPTVFENLSGNDLYVYLFSYVFADQKFMSIFSLLFGASLVMLPQKARKEHLRSPDLQNRRLLFLALFGLIHAYLIWYGHVLFMYAICGFAMFVFRRKKSVFQIRTGIALLAVGSLISLLLGYTVPFWEPGEYEAAQTEIWSPTSEEISKEIDYYTSAWERQILYRAPQAFNLQTTVFVFENFWRICGLMLIGMALYKRNVFKAKQSTKYYSKMIVYGLGIGLPLVAGGALLNFTFEWDFRINFFFVSQLNYWSSVLMAIGYIGIIMLICKAAENRGKVLQRFADVGKMALSTYLLQSIIMGIIFYGHGFGLFGEIERSIQGIFILGMWVFNILFAWVWLSMYKYGPFEWAWRSLTYGKLQSMAKD